MSCNGCSTGRGDYGVPAGCGSNGSCGTGGCNKLNVFDWLSGVSGPANQEKFDIVEVRFKNDRKAFYRNVDKIPLTVGDLICPYEWCLRIFVSSASSGEGAPNRSDKQRHLPRLL